MPDDGILPGPDRDLRADDEPAILRPVARVIELERTGVRGDGDAGERVFGRKRDRLAARRQRHGIARAILGHRSGRMAREKAGRRIHQIGLAEIAGRQEIQVEPSLSRQAGGERLVEVDRDAKAVALGGDLHLIVQPDILIGGSDHDLIGLRPAGAAEKGGDGVPLLGCAVESDRAVGGDPFAMQHDLDAGILLIEEDRTELILVDHHGQPLSLQRFGRRDRQRLGQGMGAGQQAGRRQQGKPYPFQHYPSLYAIALSFL